MNMITLCRVAYGIQFSYVPQRFEKYEYKYRESKVSWPCILSRESWGN